MDTLKVKLKKQLMVRPMDVVGFGALKTTLSLTLLMAVHKILGGKPNLLSQVSLELSKFITELTVVLIDSLTI